MTSLDMTLEIGLLGVEIPKEFVGKFDVGTMGFLRDMRLDEIERRILALEASAGEAGTATDSEAGVAEGEHATGKAGDAQDPQVQP